MYCINYLFSKSSIYTIAFILNRDERDQFKTNQEHIAAHIFSSLVTHVPFFTITRLLYKLTASFCF